MPPAPRPRHRATARPSFVVLLCHYYGLGCLYLVLAFPNGSYHDRWITSRRCADHRWMMARRRRVPPGVLFVLEAAGSSSASARRKNGQDSAFANLVANLVETIIASDAKRDTKGQDGASTGWTSWVDEAAAARLSRAVAAVRLTTAPLHQHTTNAWPQWIMACPAPVIVDYAPVLANEVRRYVAARPKKELDDDANSHDDGTALGSTSTTTRASSSSFSTQQELQRVIDNICSRLGMRLLYLPSGGTFATKWRAPPGAMIYGLALHGGIKRFRRLGGGGGGGGGTTTTGTSSSGSSSSSRRTVPRKAGERTIIVPNSSARGGGSSSRGPAVGGGDTTADVIDLSWLQYGGPERNYEALDIGPCLFMEVLLYPDGLEVPPLLLDDDHNKNDAATRTAAKDLVISSAQWHPIDFLSLADDNDDAMVQDQTITSITNDPPPPTDIGRFKDQVLLSVGGLSSQIDQIIRRVVDGRATGAKDGNGDMTFLYSLGLAPLRGMLLYGPPGCGKTQLARAIAKNIDSSRPVKIVAAPELLDRWVGSTERNIRELFRAAEEEIAQCQGDPTKSALHVIVIDEIDALFRKRSSSADAGEVTRASAVNQILAKLDGVQSLDNILLIGMTNRRELLDPALLRPGRLEAQLEIPLPDERGRRDILNIHFGPLRVRGRLSRPLCDAIDGVPTTQRSNWQRLLFSKKRITVQDLAVQTKGFSGADIAGLVRNAGSIALERTRRQQITASTKSTGVGSLDGLLVTLQDVQRALEEAKK